MRVEAISSEAARLNAIQRAQLMAALRRSALSSNKTAVAAVMDRPSDLLLSSNLPPVDATDFSDSLKSGVYA